MLDHFLRIMKMKNSILLKEKISYLNLKMIDKCNFFENRMFYKGLFKYFIDEMFSLISGEKPVPRDRREDFGRFEKFVAKSFQSFGNYFEFTAAV